MIVRHLDASRKALRGRSEERRDEQLKSLMVWGFVAGFALVFHLDLILKGTAQ